MTKEPWDTEDYFSITAAAFRDGMVRLTFADGSTIKVSPTTVLPNSTKDLRWTDMRINEFGWLMILSSKGDVELARDVVRIIAASQAVAAELGDQ